MIALRRTAPVVLATVVLTSAALAAPNGTPDPVGNCVNNATIQFNLDYAQCAGLYPALATELRDQCQSQAMVKYTQALIACGNNKTASARSGVVTGIKQNSDSGFLRRLRY